MIPLSRAASSTEAELEVTPRDNETTRQHDWSPVFSFRFVEISSSESAQLSGNPASVDPRNTENRSAPRRIRRGEQRITDPPKDGFAAANNCAKGARAFTLIELTV